MECGCDGMRGLGRESMGKAITKDSVFDSMRRVEAALKLRYMGIGFCLGVAVLHLCNIGSVSLSKRSVHQLR